MRIEPSSTQTIAHELPDQRRELTGEECMRLLDAKVERLVADALMGYTDWYLGGAADTYYYTPKAIFVGTAGERVSWLQAGLRPIPWARIDAHGAKRLSQRQQLRKLRAELVELQQSHPTYTGTETEAERENKDRISKAHARAKLAIDHQIRDLVAAMLTPAQPNLF